MITSREKGRSDSVTVWESGPARGQATAWQRQIAWRDQDVTALSRHRRVLRQPKDIPEPCGRNRPPSSAWSPSAACRRCLPSPALPLGIPSSTISHRIGAHCSSMDAGHRILGICAGGKPHAPGLRSTCSSASISSARVGAAIGAFCSSHSPVSSRCNCPCSVRPIPPSNPEMSACACVVSRGGRRRRMARSVQNRRRLEPSVGMDPVRRYRNVAMLCNNSTLMTLDAMSPSIDQKRRG
jgi:hypothetical protein